MSSDEEKGTPNPHSEEDSDTSPDYAPPSFDEQFTQIVNSFLEEIQELCESSNRDAPELEQLFDLIRDIQ